MSSSASPTKPSSAIDIVQKIGKLSLENASGSCSRDVELFLRASELERLGQISEDRVVNTQEANIPSIEASEVKKLKFEAVVPGLLSELSLEMEEYEPLNLPAEVLVRILLWVGTNHAVSLEECARTCKRLFMHSRSPQIWRHMYHTTRVCLNPVVSRPIMSYRHSYFEEPRLRTDGVYICKVSYFRPGMNDGQFYQPVHMVTYYRYLRMFPAEFGHVVILLVTTEEPKKMISLLKELPDLPDFVPFGARAIDLVSPYGVKRKAPTAKLAVFSKANVFVGKYFRHGPVDRKWYLTLYDPQSTHNSLFEMELCQQKHNALSCKRYVSVSPAISWEGMPSVYEFNTRDWNKFLFSRVKSYT